MNNHEIQFITIDGNIGSGKSTLLDNLKKKMETLNTRVMFLQEPVHEWNDITDRNGITILEKFYQDKEKYAFSFQMMAFISRLNLLKTVVDKIKNTETIEKTRCFIISERSLYTDKLVFAKMLYNTGYIEDVNYQIYLKWFDSFTDEFKIHKMVYIKVDPCICHERIQTRNRTGEHEIPLNYLTQCDEYHNTMIDKSSSECVCNTQLILDGNGDIYKNTEMLQNWLTTIQEFILQ